MPGNLYKLKKIFPKKVFKALQPAYHFLQNFLAAVFYHFPSRKLIVIGVTGTTAKTSTTYLLVRTLRAAGYKVGYTSTAMLSDGNSDWLNNKKMTMLGRFLTQKILRQMVRNGCEYAVVESTSEGARQFRHRFISYDVMIFTGLYPEHIESHGSFEKYKEAKGELFYHLKRGRLKYVNADKKVVKAKTALQKLDLERVKRTIIANLDNDYASYILSFWAEKKIGYSQDENKAAEFDKVEFMHYGEIEASVLGTSFFIGEEKFKLQLLGSFYAANAMNVIACCQNQNISLEKIKIGLESVTNIPGRFERIPNSCNLRVIVDYAFEPKAVAGLYETISLLNPEKIIHILGSTGGGRDTARRPVLGRLAGQKADYVIVTNEDPYDDNPAEIIDQVAAGALEKGKILDKDLFKIADRREAIKKGLSLLGENDILLITGKGSEQAICVASGQMIPWDDREVAKEELQALGCG